LAPTRRSARSSRRAAPAADRFARTRFVTADVARDDLAAIFDGADAVIHLAWLIQPSRDRAQTRSVNVDGSRRVFHAVAAAGVPALIHTSSVGAYSPGPKDRFVDESWPTGGI
jgi:nucleoside-diphosphate-sugar epimerase